MRRSRTSPRTSQSSPRDGMRSPRRRPPMRCAAEQVHRVQEGKPRRVERSVVELGEIALALDRREPVHRAARPRARRRRDRRARARAAPGASASRSPAVSVVRAARAAFVVDLDAAARRRRAARPRARASCGRACMARACSGSEARQGGRRDQRVDGRVLEHEAGARVPVDVAELGDGEGHRRAEVAVHRLGEARGDGDARMQLEAAAGGRLPRRGRCAAAARASRARPRRATTSGASTRSAASGSRRGGIQAQRLDARTAPASTRTRVTCVSGSTRAPRALRARQIADERRLLGARSGNPSCSARGRAQPFTLRGIASPAQPSRRDPSSSRWALRFKWRAQRRLRVDVRPGGVEERGEGGVAEVAEGVLAAPLLEHFGRRDASRARR